MFEAVKRLQPRANVAKAVHPAAKTGKEESPAKARKTGPGKARGQTLLVVDAIGADLRQCKLICVNSRTVNCYTTSQMYSSRTRLWIH